jgi:hypothetical protein
MLQGGHVWFIKPWPLGNLPVTFCQKKKLPGHAYSDFIALFVWSGILAQITELRPDSKLSMNIEWNGKFKPFASDEKHSEEVDRSTVCNWYCSLSGKTFRLSIQMKGKPVT